MQAGLILKAMMQAYTRSVTFHDSLKHYKTPLSQDGESHSDDSEPLDGKVATTVIPLLVALAGHTP
jgi:hypothetical protein